MFWVACGVDGFLDACLTILLGGDVGRASGGGVGVISFLTTFPAFPE